MSKQNKILIKNRLKNATINHSIYTGDNQPTLDTSYEQLINEICYTHPYSIHLGAIRQNESELRFGYNIYHTNNCHISHDGYGKEIIELKIELTYRSLEMDQTVFDINNDFYFEIGNTIYWDAPLKLVIVEYLDTNNYKLTFAEK